MSMEGWVTQADLGVKLLLYTLLCLVQYLVSDDGRFPTTKYQVSSNVLYCAKRNTYRGSAPGPAGDELFRYRKRWYSA